MTERKYNEKKTQEAIAFIEAKYDLLEKYSRFLSPRGFDFSISPGWIGILEEIFKYCADHNCPIRAVQIKEKFGGLRFYYDVVGELSDEDSAALDKIEAKGDITCDICGEPGNKEGSKGWIRTTCAKHKKTKYNDDIDYNRVWDLEGKRRDALRDKIYPEAYEELREEIYRLRTITYEAQKKYAELCASLVTAYLAKDDSQLHELIDQLVQENA